MDRVHPMAQVTLARRGEAWREAVLPKLPYKIGVFDVLQVRVVGTLLDQPIDGFFLVESTGTLAFGPAYGRVEVKGMTLDEAQEAIKTKLKQVLTKPEVQVTLSRQASPKEQWRETTPPQPPYRIKPGMLLSITVVGALLDQPIDGIFIVEPTGTVSLGPAYGRAQVNGLTLEAAEKAIKKKLEEILQKPEVQVTFADWQGENDPFSAEQANRRLAKERSTQAQRDAEDAAARRRAWKVVEEKEREWNEKHGPQLPKGSLRRDK
jgi:protein involved in polysaccharide export with SLBB domain